MQVFYKGLQQVGYLELFQTAPAVYVLLAL